MPYIGNTVQTQGFAPAVDYFSGNGVTVTFTLSRPVASVAQLTAVIDNVIQNPSTAYTVSGNSITFTSAPLSGTNNIWVEYTSLVTTYAAISQDPSVIGDITASGGFLSTGDFGNSYVDGTIVDYVTGRARITTGPIDDMTFYHGGSFSRSPMMDLYYAGGAKIYGTTALTIPVGTTAERPGTPAAGMIRYNSSLTVIEAYIGGSWVIVKDSSYTVNYLIVAGGGGGGNGTGGYQEGGGGGGAGGLLTSSTTLAPGTAYSVVVGSGGAGQTSGTGVGTNGSGSSLGSIGTVGGGGGGTNGAGSPGSAGGSGGGAGCQSTIYGSGTGGQGNNGGQAYVGTNAQSGGGGGAGAAGGNGSSTPSPSSGVGGVGVASSISGSSVYYAGGGGGGGHQSGGVGGNGGGGNGGLNNPVTSGTDGTANRGGGGGGGSTSSVAGRSGGSGIVIISYLGAQRGTGGTVTSSGGYTIHTFTTSGTYTA